VLVSSNCRKFPSLCAPQRHRSLQLRILCLGLLEDWNVLVGVFPQREKIFVVGVRPDSGGISIGALRGFRLQGVGASYT
jgi:hypothetical protein